MALLRYALLLFIPAYSLAQDTNLPLNTNGKVEYSAVVTVDSASAKVLYSRAKLFVTNAFVSGKDVTQLSDDETKTIAGNGLIPVSVRIMGRVWEYGDFTVRFTIQCKDGKYRYVFSDFVHEYVGTQKLGDGGSIENEKPACGTLTMTKKQWVELKRVLNEKMIALVEKLKSSMNSTADSDW